MFVFGCYDAVLNVCAVTLVSPYILYPNNKSALFDHDSLKRKYIMYLLYISLFAKTES